MEKGQNKLKEKEKRKKGGVGKKGDGNLVYDQSRFCFVLNFFVLNFFC